MMKIRRTLTWLLLAVWILGLSPPVNAASDVVFLSINNRWSTDTPIVSGGVVYVTVREFSEFNIYFSTYSTKNTLFMYNSEKELFFDLATGTSADSDGHPYAASLLYQNSMYYVSGQSVSEFFGLEYSRINSDPAPIVRIKAPGTVLSDSDFAMAASNSLNRKYTEYLAATTEAEVTAENSSPTPDSGGTVGVSSAPAESETPAPEPIQVYMYFHGISEAETPDVLNQLSKYGCQATFFVTEADVCENPDLIRRVYGEGHTLGIACASELSAEYEATSAALFAAARIKTVLVALSADDPDLAEEAAALGLIVTDREDTDLSALELASGGSSAHVGISSASSLATLFRSTKIQNYSMLAVTETAV